MGSGRLKDPLYFWDFKETNLKIQKNDGCDGPQIPVMIDSYHLFDSTCNIADKHNLLKKLCVFFFTFFYFE